MMDKLESLFFGAGALKGNEACQGCSILDDNKPIHSVMDYEELSSAPILFLSDSIKYSYGQVVAFSDKEVEGVIRKACSSIPSEDYTFSAAVKCPGVKESDMSPANREICREHLADTIRKVKPKLIFCCGNLAMKMLIKKSGITNKRGSAFLYTLDEEDYVVVPIFHPYSVLKEPRNRYLFELDIQNAYEKYILKKISKGDFSYELVDTFETLSEYNYLLTTTEPIAVDIETTGLNFLTDIMMTVGVSWEGNNIVIPIDHKDHVIETGEKFAVIKWLHTLLTNEKNKKIFHNAKFDLKFLSKYGITAVNVWDTKIMAHLVNEDIPKSLKDLVKLYFSNELEDL